MHALLLWLGLMCPLIFSPGPANLCIAGKASQSGFLSTLPLMAGFTTINVIMTLGIGLLFSTLTHGLPTLFKLLDIMGAVYVCYLSFCFFKAKGNFASPGAQSKHFGYRSAVLLQLFNGKLYPTLIMMFTVFINEATPTLSEIATISLGLCFLALLSYASWSGLGTILYRILQDKWAIFVQRYVFGGLLLLIGIKLLVESLLMSF